MLAGEVKVKQFSDPILDGVINNWLVENPFIEIVDIKFSASATSGDWGSDALIIYKEAK